MKTTVRDILETQYPDYVSGQHIADTLSMTRANIWKEIQKLKQQGLAIDATRNKGYALRSLNGNLSQNFIAKKLKTPLDSIQVYETISSTNTVMKAYCQSQTSDFKALIVSDMQEEGRGRMGRQFYSPAKTGIYMSIGFTSNLSLLDSQLITIAAALAVRRVIARNTKAEPTIKWLNDIFIGNRKICGILTEGDINLETSSYNFLIVGIGLNLFATKSVPKDIKDIYGYVLSKHTLDRNDIIAEITDEFFELIKVLPHLIDEYKAHCNVLNKDVLVGDKIYHAIDIDQSGYLVLQDNNGAITHHHSGEISIKEHTL